MWNDSTLMRFIKDNSSFTELLPQEPLLEGNPLVRDNITKDQIDLRKELDNIQGTNQDDDLTGQIVRAITIGSKIQPIPKDHPYSNQEIGDFLKHLDKSQEWYDYKEFKTKEENFNFYKEIELIPIFSCLYSIDKEDEIIVMSSNDNYIVELETNIVTNLIGGRYRNQINNFRRSTFDQIDGLTMGIDFEELRKRLISSGYSNIVNQVNEQLQNY